MGSTIGAVGIFHHNLEDFMVWSVLTAAKELIKDCARGLKVV